jgi:serine/threonine protein phosphatase PrpC
MTPRIYTLNQIGQRENVEDSISKWQPGMQPVYVVCDGVGGNNFGEVASQKAVDSFYQTLTSQYININNLNSFRKCMGHALFKFTAALQDFIAENPVGKNASSTLAVVALTNKQAFIAWCGDSRIYHIRDGEILYKTKDHSLVQELVNNNVITEQEAMVHPQKNVITKSLHAKTAIEDIEFHEIKNLQPGDFLLMCTDGLLEHCTEERLNEILRTPDPGNPVSYDKVINEICFGRTHDNYSMILVQYPPKKKSFKWAALVSILLIAGVLGYFLVFGKKSSGTAPVTPVKETVQQDTTAKSPDTTAAKRSGFKTLTSSETITKKDTVRKNKPKGKTNGNK